MLEIFQTELDTGHIGKTLENISLTLLELDKSTKWIHQRATYEAHLFNES